MTMTVPHFQGRTSSLNTLTLSNVTILTRIKKFCSKTLSVFIHSLCWPTETIHEKFIKCEGIYYSRQFHMYHLFHPPEEGDVSFGAEPVSVLVRVYPCLNYWMAFDKTRISTLLKEERGEVQVLCIVTLVQ